MVANEGRIISFVVKSKKISLDTAKLRKLIDCDIPIFNINNPGLNGRAYRNMKDGKGSIGLNFNNLVNPKCANSVIQAEITKTLAHEIKHIFQSGDKSRWQNFFKKIGSHKWLFFVFFLMGLDGGLANIFFEVPTVFNNILIVVILLTAGLIAFGESFYWYFDSDEKDARIFANEAVKQKQWLGIVQVADFKE